MYSSTTVEEFLISATPELNDYDDYDAYESEIDENDVVEDEEYYDPDNNSINKLDELKMAVSGLTVSDYTPLTLVKTIRNSIKLCP